MIQECSTADLQLAIEGSLPPDREQSLFHHLENCEVCRATMEELAGVKPWCEMAVPLLSTDELDRDVPSREEWSEADFTVENLEPSDQPNVLGRLGGYDVLEIIGRGGMGVVLKGFDRELNRYVAIKVLAPHLAHSSLAKKRFIREAQAAAAVVHPHVMAIHQVQPSGRLPFLVMPLVAGESLAQRLIAQGRLEMKETLRIGMQAAAGLAAAHEQGLVHRDVKPANILLEKGVERAVLTDFGLARAADDVSMTRWGIIAGTPQYMSPEQAQGEAVDGRSDLFSLGCMLYEMATGVSPFRADSTMATLRRLIDDPPPAMAARNPELPPWFVAIVERLLEKDPARRYASAKEVSELLERCLAHLQQPNNVPLPAVLANLRRPEQACAVPAQLGFVTHQCRNFASLFRPTGLRGVAIVLSLVGIGLFAAAIAATNPPDISGKWQGEDWGEVALTPTTAGEYSGTFSDTVTKDPGKVSLRWSRIERRFNGTWNAGDRRFGMLSVRLVDQEIRGAMTTDEKSKINPGTPRLADLLWTLSHAQPSLGQVPPRDSASKTPEPGLHAGAVDDVGSQAGFKFGPVVELTLAEPGDGRACLLNLATGKAVTPPPELARELADGPPPLYNSTGVFDNHVGAEMARLDADVAVIPSHSGVRGEERVLALFGGIATSVYDTTGSGNDTVKEERIWDQSADYAVQLIRGTSPRLKRHLELIPYCSLQSGGKLPQTFEFQTRSGAMGVLQVLGDSKTPPGVKIRYKLLQPVAATGKQKGSSKAPGTSVGQADTNVPPATPAFGSIVQRPLTSAFDEVTSYLDLDTGRYIDTPADEVEFSDKFLRRKGIDLCAGGTEKEPNSRTALDMVVGKISETAWDDSAKWTPEEAQVNLARNLGGREPGVRVISAPGTFAFGTREGGFGLLRLVVPKPSPAKPAILVQYKLLRDLPRGWSPCKYEFGPVVEVMLPEPAAGKACLLNLTTGTLSLPSPTVATKLKAEGFDAHRVVAAMAEANVDLIGIAEHVGRPVIEHGLTLCDGMAIDAAWTDSAYEVACSMRELAELRMKSETGTWWPYCFLPATPTKPDAWALKTRSGQMAILQIAAYDEKAASFKIRYKLVKQNQPPTATAAASLEFHIVPNPPKSGHKPAYPEFSGNPKVGFAEAAVKELAALGPDKSQPGSGEFRWFELPPQVPPRDFLIGEYQKKRFILVCAREPNALLPKTEGQDAWAVESAVVESNEFGRQINLRLNRRGGELLRALSKVNLGSTLAAVVDGRVVVMARIISEIRDQVVITGSFSEEEIEALASKLRPAAAKPESQKPAVKLKPEKTAAAGAAVEKEQVARGPAGEPPPVRWQRNVTRAARGHYEITLPNGVRVKVLGVCGTPRSNPRWWQPNSEPLAKPLADRLQFTSELPAERAKPENEFVLVVEQSWPGGAERKPGNLPQATHLISPTVAWWGDVLLPPDAAGTAGARPDRLSLVRALDVAFREVPESIVYQCGITIGPWETAARFEPGKTSVRHLDHRRHRVEEDRPAASLSLQDSTG